MRKFSRIVESNDPNIDEIKWIFIDLIDNGFKVEIKPYWEDGIFYFYAKDNQQHADKSKNGYLITGKTGKMTESNPFKVLKDFQSIEKRMLDLGYELDDDDKSADNSLIEIGGRWLKNYEFRFPFKEMKKDTE